jgi:hypothetical protein
MAGVGHNLPVRAADALHFFGLDVPPPTTSPTLGAAGTCAAEAATGSRWSTGFVVTVTITAGASAITGWKATLALADGATITGLWNGQSTGVSGTVTVVNNASNGALAAGASVSFGYQGSGADDAVTVTCTPR